MNKQDIQKLIGGYATGTLTDQERKALFEAALDNQELFDSLQDEQPLKELFDDPFSREQVRSAAAESLPQSQKASRISWFRRPWIWASAASVALAGVLVVALVRWDRMQPQPELQKQVVASRQQPAAPVVEEKSPPTPPEPEKPVAGKPPAVKSPEARSPRARTAHGSFGREDTKVTLSAEAPRGISRRSSNGYRASVSNPEPRDPDLEHRASPPGNSEIARNAPSGPSNSNSTLRDAEKNRNTDEPVKKEADKDRNEIALSAPRPAPAPAPPQQPAPQVQQAEKQQGQLDRPAQQSGPSQSQSQSTIVQAVPSSGAPRERSQGTLEQPPRKTAATKTESSDELLKDQRKSKSSGGATFGAARVIAGHLGAPYLLARQLNDGSFATVPSATAFKPGEVLRLTVNPGNSGPVQILEWDENDPQWRKVYPPADDLDTAAKTASATFVVQKSLRVRVTISSTTIDIPIRIVEAAR